MTLTFNLHIKQSLCFCLGEQIYILFIITGFFITVINLNNYQILGNNYQILEILGNNYQILGNNYQILIVYIVVIIRHCLQRRNNTLSNISFQSRFKCEKIC